MLKDSFACMHLILANLLWHIHIFGISNANRLILVLCSGLVMFLLLEKVTDRFELGK